MELALFVLAVWIPLAVFRRFLALPDPRDRAAIAFAIPLASVSLLHFIWPKRLLVMMPSFFSHPVLLIYVSGVFELLGAVGLFFRRTRWLAGVGVVALLIAVFPANIHMALSGLSIQGLPTARWYYWVRLPFQAMYIGWVIWAARICSAGNGQEQTYWKLHARSYDGAALFLNRQFPQMAQRVAEDVRGRKSVLELAAGTGLLTVELARTVGGLVATDREKGMLDVLRARLVERGLTQVEVREADAYHLAEKDGTVDAVVAANLLHVVPHPDRVLAEARRVLKPGGLLAVPTFAHGETLLSRSVSRVLALTGFPIATRFKIGDVENLVRAAGFQITQSTKFAGIIPMDYVLAQVPVASA